MFTKKSAMFIFIALALTFSAVGVTPAYAATLTVTNTADSGAGSLRDAIANASPGDTIIFDTSLSGGIIHLASTLTLFKNVTIDGSALASKITISGDTDNNGAGNVRVFNVNSGVIATLNSLIITKGATSGNGGGIYNDSGTLTVTNGTFSDNSAVNTGGGGIYNHTSSTLTVTNSTFSGNSASFYGGGIMNLGALTVTDSTFSGNSAGFHGGGIYNFYGTLTVTNSIISGNSADNGGGIYNNGTSTVTNSTFSGNSALYGGGIDNDNGTLTVTNSMISGNSADYGGGIYNFDIGTLIVTNSTLSGNTATNHGGGIYNHASSTLTVTNSTLSGNTAIDYGGGIYNSAALTIINSTLSGNSASNIGGGINNSFSGTLNYANTIIANSSSGGDCANAGTLGTNTSNLVEDASCSAFLSGDPSLSALSSNGGLTQTFALLAGSPAIDTGNNAICAAAPVNNTSQNGVTRPQGAACDIGSYESGGASTFVDVPFTHPQWKYIQALYDSGYTAGCSTSPLMFCPDTILDRAQSAVFMLRGQLGSGYAPPPAPWNTFLADSWVGFEYAQSWADGMWQEGLTAGCQASPLMYCPATQLPRVEASVFGLKMKYGVGYIPPSATGTLLADMTDPAYWGASWAEQAYRDGLLPACGTDAVSGKPMFCPSELVTRAWGAYLIVQAKGLPTP